MKIRALIGIGSGLMLAVAAALSGSPETVISRDISGDPSQGQPIAVPLDTENTLLVELPGPLQEWAGRGFTSDPGRFAGDIVIEAQRGSSRLFLTPLKSDARRILHAVFETGDGGTRSLVLELLAAPPGVGWHKLVLTQRTASSARLREVSPAPLPSAFREASADSALGLLHALRMLRATGQGSGKALERAEPRFEIDERTYPASTAPEFSLEPVLRVQLKPTGETGLCVRVRNRSTRRILIDPLRWSARAASSTWPASTVDFSGLVEPLGCEEAYLVLPPVDGRVLAPTDELSIAANLSASYCARPVASVVLPGWDIP